MAALQKTLHRPGIGGDMRCKGLAEAQKKLNVDKVAGRMKLARQEIQWQWIRPTQRTQHGGRPQGSTHRSHGLQCGTVGNGSKVERFDGHCRRAR